MDDPIYTFFSENLAMVSKEEILKALGNALRSADYWREACLLGYPSLQGRSEETMAPSNASSSLASAEVFPVV